MSRSRLWLMAFVCVAALLLVPCAAAAQTARTARVQVTVVDPSGAVIPEASVDIVGLEDATQKISIPQAKTTGSGVAQFDAVVPGRYSIRATFPGFDIGLLRDVRIRAGDSRHVVVLPLQRLEDSVTVTQDTRAAASDRKRSEFGLALNDDQIQALSDDPQELARQLADLAGPEAVVRVDSFEGQQLPPKAQIKSIHVVRDQFAAEAAQPGTTFVDVVTQPGIGPLRGGLTTTMRADAFTGKSRFTETRGPEEYNNVSGNLGGTIFKGKTSFSASLNRNSTTTTPILHAQLPDGVRAETLNLRQPVTITNTNILVDHAITRDQTLRIGYNQNHFAGDNFGVGNYDLPERGTTQANINRNLRIQEAGPLGRRTFMNTRLVYTWGLISTTSNVDAPTIIVQDAFNIGGAQQHLDINPRQMMLASDVDHVRGIHSFRFGTQLETLWFSSSSYFNDRGTYTFSSLDDYRIGHPAVYTQSIGRPLVSYFNIQNGIYFQDDMRVHGGLTISPGVRYSLQNRISDKTAFEPRLGVTWAPGNNGRTTIRGSAGIFHGFLQPPWIEQSLRQDGVQQRDLVIVDPSYPDPQIGSGILLPSSKYLIGDFNLQRNVRYSAGVDRVVSPRVRVNVLYNYIHQQQQPRGHNLNAPVNGVRPDPDYANVIEMITDAEIRRHELTFNTTLQLAAPSPALQAARFNWRRVQLNATYAMVHAQNNSGGAWTVSPTGDLDDDWGPGPADQPYRVQLLVNSTQLRNTTVSVNYLAFSGFPYTWTTGYDDNRDGFLNDRPAGVGLRSLRGAGQQGVNVRVAYGWTIGRAAIAGPGQQGRYRLQLFTQMNNLTNHQNLTGYSGVQTSNFFMQPTAATNLRKVDFGVGINF